MIETSTMKQCGDPEPLSCHWYIPWTSSPQYERDCHGCRGLGWIETKDGKPHVCPVCGGSGKYTNGNYTITWNDHTLSDSA